MPEAPAEPSDETPNATRPRSGCGHTAQWLATALCDPSATAGRLLVYCDSCGRSPADRIGAVLPLPILDRNPDTVLTLLDESGSTRSDPDLAPRRHPRFPGAWQDTARRVIAQDR